MQKLGLLPFKGLLRQNYITVRTTGKLQKTNIQKKIRIENQRLISHM